MRSLGCRELEESLVMAKISILIYILCINIFLKISILSPFADPPFLPPLSSHAHQRKENAPIHGPMSTLITLKFFDCCRRPRSTTSSSHHLIYVACRSHIAITASNVACPDVATSDLCATDTEQCRGKNRRQRW